MNDLPVLWRPQLDTIYQFDALAFLRQMESESVDIVVTSPPYNLSWHKSSNSGMFQELKWVSDFWSGYENYSDSLPEMDYQKWMHSIIAECLRVSKGLVWVNHKTRFRDGIGIHPLSFLTFPLWSEVVWNRGGSMTLNSRRFAPSHEYVFGFGRPHYWNDAHNTAMTVWRVNPPSGKSHPCPYPEALIRPLIDASCPPGGIVLDPFIGSGTTAIASLAANRHYIGCDISPQYVAEARRRLGYGVTVPMFALPESEAS